MPRPKADSAWADLGSGKGLFTRALATLLGPGSTVYAVDRSRQKMPPSFNGNAIVFHQLDFSEGKLPFAPLDGILMANSIHFVKDKPPLLSRLRKHLGGNGQLLIIEYEQDKGNAWVPYPIPYKVLAAQLADCGFKDIAFAGERQSLYGDRKMYVCSAINGHG